MGKASRLIKQKTLQNMMYNVWQHVLTEKNWYLLIDVYKSVLVVEHKKIGIKNNFWNFDRTHLNNVLHKKLQTQKIPNQLNKQTKQNKTPNKTNEQMRNKPHKKEKQK